jgi:hypothetical protein
MESRRLSVQDETEMLGKIKKLCRREEVPVKVITVDAFVETESGKINRRMTMNL